MSLNSNNMREVHPVCLKYSKRLFILMLSIAPSSNFIAVFHNKLICYFIRLFYFIHYLLHGQWIEDQKVFIHYTVVFMHYRTIGGYFVLYPCVTSIHQLLEIFLCVYTAVMESYIYNGTFTHS